MSDVLPDQRNPGSWHKLMYQVKNVIKQNLKKKQEVMIKQTESIKLNWPNQTKLNKSIENH